MISDFPLARITSSVSVMLLIQLRQLHRSAAGTLFRRGDNDPLARQVLGKRLARRAPRSNERHALRPPSRRLRCQLVLGRSGLEVLQLQIHLLQEARLALRATAVEGAAQLLDLQLEMRDQRISARMVGLGGRRFPSGRCRNGLSGHCRCRFLHHVDRANVSTGARRLRAIVADQSLRLASDWRRQANSWLGLMPRCRSTCDTEQPGRHASSTSWSFSSSLHRRRYRQKVADVHAALTMGDEASREAITLVRELIERITVEPTPPDEPPTLELFGNLADLMRHWGARRSRRSLFPASVRVVPAFRPRDR